MGVSSTISAGDCPSFFLPDPPSFQLGIPLFRSPLQNLRDWVLYADST